MLCWIVYWHQTQFVGYIIYIYLYLYLYLYIYIYIYTYIYIYIYIYCKHNWGQVFFDVLDLSTSFINVHNFVCVYFHVYVQVLKVLGMHHAQT